MRARRAASMALAAVLACAGWAVAIPAPARAALAVVGVADSLTVKHDRTAVVPAPGVLGNDVHLLGDTTASLVQNVSHGSLDLRPDGGYTYTPAGGYVGTDSFRYRPSGLLSTGATVTITVTNAAPIARADAYATPSRTNLIVPAPGVLANDTDGDGDSLLAELVSASGVSGSIDLEPNGALTYSPGGGFSGSVSITYRVTDGIAWSGSTTVTISVAAATPAPTPVPTPTPRPTPTATPLLPLPTLQPLPSLLPLPPLPLPSPSPSLPLISPLPSIGPTASPAPTPTEPSGSEAPSAAPSRGPGRSGVSTPGASPSPDSTDADAVGGIPGGGLPGESGGGSAAPVAIGAGGLGVRTTRASDDDVGELGVRILGGLDVSQLWFVPAGVFGGPGVLVILWVILQVGAGTAWLPAARRLRGDEGNRGSGHPA